MTEISLGVVGSRDIAHELTQVGFSVVSSEDPIASAALSSSTFLTIVIDSPSHPPLLSAMVDNLVAQGVRVAVLDCPGGVLASSNADAAHISRSEPVNLAVLLSQCGVEPARAIAAATVTIPRIDSEPPTAPVRGDAPPSTQTAVRADPVRPEPYVAPERTSAFAQPPKEPFEPVSVTPASVDDFEPVPVADEPPPATYKPTPSFEPPPAAFEPAPAAFEPAPAADHPFEPPVGVYTPSAGFESVRTPIDQVSRGAFESLGPVHASHRARAFAFDDDLRREQPNQGILILVMSGKGGALKTTLSMCLAQAVGRHGLKATLIDANRGQADVSTMLRLRPGFPTIWNYAMGSAYSEIAMTPAMVSDYRPSILDDVLFKFVAGPNAGTSDAKTVTHRVYQDVINNALNDSDVVIVDTQIMEDSDQSGLFTNVFLPALRNQRNPTWSVFLTETSRQSRDNMVNRVTSMVKEEAVDASHILLCLTQKGESDDKVEQQLIEAVSNGRLPGTWVGSVPFDEAARSSQALGHLIDGNATFVPVVTTVLSSVTGDPRFDTEKTSGKKKRFSWRRR